MTGNFFEISLAGRQLRVRAGDSDYRHRYVWNGTGHTHGEYELHIVLSGKATLEVGKKSYQLAQGTAIIVAPGLYHKAKAEDGKIDRFAMQIMVPDGAQADIMQQVVPDCRLLTASKEICRLCSDYYYEAAAANPYQREQMQALLTQLLISVFREVGAGQVTRKKEAITSPLERKICIDSFFGENFSTEAKQEDLAKKLHLSQRQMARFLQKHYGMSFREMLIRARMEHAAWLLRTTDQTVPKVAAQVGYKSESAFYKVFCGQYNKTPRQYRRDNKNE